MVGVVTGRRETIRAGAVVLTTGTFLTGLIHIGETRIPAGRMGEAPSLGLSKTSGASGISPRAAEDRHALPPRRQEHRLGQPGDAAGRRSAAPFSFLTDKITVPQIECGITAHHAGDAMR